MLAKLDSPLPELVSTLDDLVKISTSGYQYVVISLSSIVSVLAHRTKRRTMVVSLCAMFRYLLEQGSVCRFVR